MRSLEGFDTRRGFYTSPRLMFKGDLRYVELANMIFPWVDDHRDNLITEDMSTSKGFLDMIVNMRRITLQDCALLVGKYKRGHFMFDTFPEIFKSSLFKDFTTKLMKHIDESEYPNDAKVDNVLPGVLDDFDAHTRAIKKLREDITRERGTNRLAEVNSVAKLKVELKTEVA